MNSRKVSQKVMRHNERGEEARRGMGEGGIMRLGSLSVAEKQIVNFSRLPVTYNDGPDSELQDADGNFYFLEGYSMPGGPDIGASGAG